MTVHRAALMLVERGRPLDLPPQLVVLDAEEEDYVERHVAALRSRATDSEALHARFQGGSDVPGLLRHLLTATDGEFLTVTATFATRLHSQMQAVPRPSPGILAVVTTSDGAEHPSDASILKLDATTEAARYVRRAGQIRLNVLHDLLPSPGDLQKGLSIPDSRPISDVIIRDRNVEAARYFLNAFHVLVSPRPARTTRELLQVIAELPDDDIPRAYERAATEGGPADEVVARLREEFPDLDLNREAFGAQGAVPGILRPDRLVQRPMRLRADGFIVEVPPDRVQRVRFEQQGDGWVIVIETDSKPRWEAP